MQPCRSSSFQFTSAFTHSRSYRSISIFQGVLFDLITTMSFMRRANSVRWSRRRFKAEPFALIRSYQRHTLFDVESTSQSSSTNILFGLDSSGQCRRIQPTGRLPPPKQLKDDLFYRQPVVAFTDPTDIPQSVENINIHQENVQYIGSYNWIDSLHPTIIVPGRYYLHFLR